MDEKQRTFILKMFPKIDIVRASARFEELNNNMQKLINECLDGRFPKEAAPVESKSEDFMSDDPVPTAYQTFALKFLTNEFPRLNPTFLNSKLTECKFHIFPTFKYIFKKYFLCDCVLSSTDEEGKYIYELDNDVKANFTNTSAAIQKIDNDEFQAVVAYPLLKLELAHIAKKRQSYQKKVASIKALINKRTEILSKSGLDSLITCVLCDSHYLEDEICNCKNNHHICKYCLRGNLITECLTPCVSKTKCVLDGCGAEFRNEGVKLALGRKRFQQYENIRFSNELSVLKDDPNTYRCRFCPYRFTSSKKPDFVVCLYPSCRKITCLACGKEKSSHKSGICPVRAKEEAEKEQARKKLIASQAEVDFLVAKGIDAKQRNAEEEARRMQIELEKKKREKEKQHKEELELDLKNFVKEKVAGSVICTCPGTCKTKIIKNQGCNHIHCPKCGCDFCYQCRKIIPFKPGPYTPHVTEHYRKGNPTGCNQFLKQDEMDKLSRAQAERDAVQEWRANHINDPLAAGIQYKL